MPKSSFEHISIELYWHLAADDNCPPLRDPWDNGFKNFSEANPRLCEVKDTIQSHGILFPFFVGTS